MLGFLVHDEDLFPSSEAIRACRALRTYEYQGTDGLGRLRVHFFRNASPNTYFASDERYTLGITGTLIVAGVHGQLAITHLLDRLRGGRTLPELFDELKGPYNLVLIDRRAEELSILNSREGLRNFFATTSNGLNAYSTNLLLLAALTGSRPSPDGVRQYLHLNATIGRPTIFHGIERLPPAVLHRHRDDRWSATRLWRIQVSPPDPAVSRPQATRQLMELFLRDFEFTARIDEGRVVSDLTGGTDSRLVLCCLMEKHSRPVASTAGGEDFVDVSIARRVASRLSIDHYWYRPTTLSHDRIARAVELSDGIMSPISLAKELPYYDEKARRFDVITGGAGGPLFKDHYWLYEFNRVGLPREPHWTRIARFSLVGHAIQDDFVSGFDDTIVDNMAELFRAHSANVTGTNNQKLDFVYFDLKTPSVSSPAFSLATQFMDIFHPMVDGRNVQFSINLPPAIRIRNILQFGVIRQLRPELSWIPTDNGLPTIPPIGLHSWLRILRARRYVTTAIRKLQHSSGQRAGTDAEQLRGLGYLDLLEHSSLAFSSLVSSRTLAEFKDDPLVEPNQSYLIASLDLQLFFERVKELRSAARTLSASPSPQR
jgi:hypothetical protein